VVAGSVKAAMAVTHASSAARGKLWVAVVATQSDDELPRGGHGGDAIIVDGPGIAVGGNGGRGGAKGYGQGGDGGRAISGPAKVLGPGLVKGGDGGDAGRPWRPALGAQSPLASVESFSNSFPGKTDIYGIPQPGKGGDSYIAYIEWNGRKYCMNILLQLIQLSKPSIIDRVDEMAADLKITAEQDWWNLAIKEFPEETEQVMAHMRTCEDRKSPSHG
jgi:hypothetical protein